MNKFLVGGYILFLLFCFWVLNNKIYEKFDQDDPNTSSMVFTEDFSDLSTKQWIGLKITNNSFIHWTEAKFYDASGSEITDKSAFTASQSTTQEGEGGTADKILDNNSDTFQHTTGESNEWVLIDFGSPISLSKIELIPRYKINLDSYMYIRPRYINTKIYLVAEDNTVLEYPLYKSENKGFDIKTTRGYLVPDSTNTFLKHTNTPDANTKWEVIETSSDKYRLKHISSGKSLKSKTGGWNISASETTVGLSGDDLDNRPYLFNYDLEDTGSSKSVTTTTTHLETDFYDVKFTPVVNEDKTINHPEYVHIKFIVASETYSDHAIHYLQSLVGDVDTGGFSTWKGGLLADVQDDWEGNSLRFAFIDSDSNWNKTGGVNDVPNILTLNNQTVFKTKPSLVIQTTTITTVTNNQNEYDALKTEYLAQKDILSDTEIIQAKERMRELKAYICKKQDIYNSVNTLLELFWTKYVAIVDPLKTNQDKLYDVLIDPTYVSQVDALSKTIVGLTSTDANCYMDTDVDYMDFKDNVMMLLMGFTTVSNNKVENGITLLSTYKDIIQRVYEWEKPIFDVVYASDQNMIDFQNAIIDLFTTDINTLDSGALFSQITDIQKTYIFDKWFTQVDAPTIAGKLSYLHQKEVIKEMPAKKIVNSFDEQKKKNVIEEIPGKSFGLFGKLVGGMFN